MTMPKLISLLIFLFLYLIAVADAQIGVCTAKASKRPNDKSLDTVDPAAYGCGAACQKTLTEAIELDRIEIYGNIPFDEDFYATAANFSAETSQPGDLLKVQAYVHTASNSDWFIPGGTTLFRIQYVTLAVNNTVAPATAFVAFPLVKRPGGKPFDMVALAHGTIGTHYGCAPSTSYNLYDYDTWRPIFLAGYAVVATDYTGLGNNYTQHFWEANTLNGNDVYFSAVAAKRAFPDWLSDEWVAIGHSEGGGAIWGLAESELVSPSGPCKDVLPTFLGAAALEPGVRVADEIAFALEAVAKGVASPAALGAYANYIYAGLNAVQPGSADHLFTPNFIQRQVLGNALGACFYVEASLSSDIVAATGLTSILTNATTFAADPVIQNFQALYGAGTGKPAQAPLLVVQSTADETIPYPVIQVAVKAACAAGGFPVQFSVYPDTDHSASLGASAPEWLQWIGDRFAGVELPKSCTVMKYRAVDAAAAYLPLDF